MTTTMTTIPCTYNAGFAEIIMYIILLRAVLRHMVVIYNLTQYVCSQIELFEELNSYSFTHYSSQKLHVESADGGCMPAIPIMQAEEGGVQKVASNPLMKMI